MCLKVYKKKLYIKILYLLLQEKYILIFPLEMAKLLAGAAVVDVVLHMSAIEHIIDTRAHH